MNLACAPQRVHIIERDLIRERTQAGLAAARARGRSRGRPSVMTPTRSPWRQMHASRRYTVAAIAKTLGVGRASIYRHLPVGVAVQAAGAEDAKERTR